MKYSKYLIAASFLAVSATTLAAGTVSNQTSRTVDLTFNSPLSPVSLNISPASNLTAGSIFAMNSLGTVTLSSTLPERYAVRFGPYTNTFVGDGSPTKAIASGITNPDNKLSVNIATGSTLVSNITMDNGEIYTVTVDPITFAKFELHPTTNQTVAPDTYRLSVEAAVYKP